MYNMNKLLCQMQLWKRETTTGTATNLSWLSNFSTPNIEHLMPLKDKVLIIGGWKPYRNLNELFVFDPVK